MMTHKTEYINPELTKLAEDTDETPIETATP
jgi:hypothetical protein